MRRKLIVGNWKMNGDKQLVSRLLANIRAVIHVVACDIAVCPPFAYLASCESDLQGTRIDLGAQDLSEHTDGAFTGEVSGGMLRDLGCRYVIVGHSERRIHHGEDDRLVALKTRRALQAGLSPIVCVGETAEERRDGATHAVLARQMDAITSSLEAVMLSRIVIAYEPVWAIGTGATATPATAQEAHAFLRGSLARLCGEAAGKVRILYGGSMKPENAPALLAMPDIDGGLIGGASLDPAQFCQIVRARGHSC